jgi:hypothetical protein
VHLQQTARHAYIESWKRGAKGFGYGELFRTHGDYAN